MKKKILGVALAAVMMFGSTGAVMAADSTYSFDKVYNLDGITGKENSSPAETFSFVAGTLTNNNAEAENKASLYWVEDSSYNSKNVTDRELVSGLKNDAIPAAVKTLTLGTVGYEAGGASDNDDNKSEKSVTVTVPDASAFGSVGYYYYQFHEKQGDTAGVTYSSNTYYIRVAVICDSANTLKIGGVKLYVSNAEDPNSINKVLAVGNLYSAGALKLSKEVTGNLGNPDQEFAVSVKFKAPSNKKIKLPIIISTINGDGLNNPEKIEIADNVGENQVSTTVQVKDKTEVEFSNVPAGVTYEVEETKSEGYDNPKYLTEANPTTPTETEPSGNIEAASSTNIKIINNKEEKIDTGVFTSNIPYIIILAGAAACLVLFFAGKKRRTED